MTSTYFGFAVADSMFPATANIQKKPISPVEARALIVAGVVSCCNPSHKETILAAKSRFDIEVEIHEKPPHVSLAVGDSVVVMGVRGLPRLTDRHEYTEEEVAKATFVFSLYTVVA